MVERGLGLPAAPPGQRRRIAVAYLAGFLLLDWASYIHPLQGLNITPWNPQTALAVALLVWNRRAWPLVVLGLVLAEVLVRGARADLPSVLATSAVLTLVYAALAQVLRQTLRAPPPFATLAELARFLTLVAAGALVGGVLYVAALLAAGGGPSGSLAAAVARYWVGDAVGLLVVLPLALAALDPVQRAALAAVPRHRASWVGLLLLAAALAVVFGRGGEEQFRAFYLLLLPVLWSAIRLGLPGALYTTALTQIALIGALRVVPQPDLAVYELQMLMAAIALVGLVVGTVVDERARTAAELRASLQLAAAGQTAAALAHELAQPLTALATYAEACRMLAAAPDAAARLSAVAGRMIDEAQRAGAVVQRLRDFFRSGAAQLRSVAAPSLLGTALDAQRGRAAALGIALESDLPPTLPAVLVDPVQLGVVLRNLLANALDAAAAAPAPRRVRLGAAVDGGQLRISVEDSGAGVAAAQLAALFEPAPSAKPGGMGVGLVVSRAIVQAHGGRLWAEAGPGGRFFFTVPLDTAAGAGDAA